METEDCYTHQITEEMKKPRTKIDENLINPATGFIFVKDAYPGDVLKIYIDKIQLDDQGVVTTGHGVGPLGDLVEEGTAKIADIHSNGVNFLGYSLNLEPMIGVIGLAPKGKGVKCDTPGPHGGNIDALDISEGSLVYLPINVEGAKLAREMCMQPWGMVKYVVRE